MSRTVKRYKYVAPGNRRKPKWRGVKQNIRDNMRYKLKHRDMLRYRSNSDYTCQQWHVIRVLFSKGRSLEEIRKCLVDKHRCGRTEANRMIHEFGPSGSWQNAGNIAEFYIKGVICVKDGYAVSAAHADLEPHFLLETDLPLYYWSDYETLSIGTKFYYTNYFGGGDIVYVDGKIFKFSPNDSVGNQGANYRKQDNNYQSAKLKVWPNKKITPMVGEIIDLHINSGMEDCSFKIHGWKKLRYTIEVIRSK